MKIDLLEVSSTIGAPRMLSNPTVTYKKEKINYKLTSNPSENQVFISTITVSGEFENKLIKTTKKESTMFLFGDEFLICNDSKGFFIQHPKWNLMGEGDTLQEAQESLLENILLAKQTLVESEVQQLDASAFNLREYLLNSINV